jgi:hypothetical protein
VASPLDDLTAAIAAVLAAADAEPDPLDAYRLATRASAAGRALLDDAAAARGRALARIEGDPLSGVAESIGLSKTRVAQLINLAGRAG